MGLVGLGGSDCEALRDGWLGQPANGLSSLAYVLAGVYVVRAGRVLPGVALAAVGVGSALYHGPMPSGAALVHDGSIVVLALTIGFSWWRRSIPRPPLVSILAAACGLTIYLLSRTDGPLCEPDSPIQGHAVWHVLTAVAAGAWLGRAGPASTDASRR